MFADVKVVNIQGEGTSRIPGGSADFAESWFAVSLERLHSDT
jgi:hypothetical protein